MLFDPVRSAEPPSVSGITALMTSSTISDDFRVATFGAVSLVVLRNAARADASFFGASPAITRSNSACLAPESLPKLSFQADRAAAPWAPIFRQAPSTSSGISNGGHDQP